MSMTDAAGRGPDPDVPGRRRVGRPPTLDRAAALRAARHVIAQRGLNRTRYSDVAEASGIPVTSLQHSFGSLQGMLLESMKFAIEVEVEAMRGQAPVPGETAWQRIVSVIEYALDPPEDPESWPVWVEFWALAGRDAELGQRAGQVYERWWDYVAELIAVGIERGEFGTRQPPDDAARVLTGLMDGVGVAFMMRADGPDRETARRLIVDGARELLGVQRP